MFLQFFTKRRFYIHKDEVISTGRGVDKDLKDDSYSVGNRGVIEVKDKKAKELLKMYGKECEPWGKDAVIKKEPTKAKNSRPQGNIRNLDD